MTENQTISNAGMYGYATDEVKQSPFTFGLNAGKTFLIKFEWIPNGGKDGAEQEALDIVFNINGTEKNYRMFPVVKAFGKNNEEITDPNAPEFKDAVVDFNARVTHILHAYMDSEAIKSGFSRPIASFKDFVQIAMSMLPKNYREIPLDIFLQYQWQLPQGKERTYLEIPGKMKYGKWLAPAQAGTWKENRVENPADNVTEALFYTNEEGVKHPFTKNGWFMNSNFAKQQRSSGGTESGSPVSSAQQTQNAANMQSGTGQASAW